MVTLADRLIEDGAGNEAYQLHGLWLLITDLIDRYDQEHYPSPELRGTDMLQFLRVQHDLSPSDLPEVGDQQVVSEVLGGKRELNINQIKALSARFKVNPGVFL